MSHSDPYPAKISYSNGTAPLEESNSVSWQSAFWPVVACTLAVMLQNAGRVCGARYCVSYALRVSPLICAVDTLLMIIKFGWMLFLRCSLRTAVRHVWYDRFVRESQLEADGLMLHVEEGRDFARSYHENPPGAVVLPTFVGGRGGPDSSEGVGNGQMCVEPSIMSGALTTPMRVMAPIFTPSESRISTGDIADNAIEFTATPAGLDSDGSSIDDPVILPGGTNLLTGRDLEAGTSTAGAQHEPLTGACQYSDFYPGSGIDRSWRLAMAGFLVGVLPQAIKIFGMRGIVLTQVIVGIQLSSFMVQEVFRMMAGTAGAAELHPMPSVVFAKQALEIVEQDASFFAAGCSTVFCVGLLFLWSMLYILDNLSFPVRSLVLINLLLVGPLVAGALYRTWKYLLELSATRYLLKAIALPRCLETTRKKWIAKLLGLFAIQPLPVDVIYGFFVSITLLESIAFMVAGGQESELMHVIAPVSVVIVVPALLLFSDILFQVLSMGSLSKHPCELFGLEGTLGEFLTFAFIGLHILGLLVLYDPLFYSPIGTYKPHWVDMLG
ncbi:hypothetical protein DE146DRAFT_791214 [Phaeosphaeria sp. MPI-PUGE-AT-0046c]|nr:hypothetical protein DE146DRAFT_791214 [Phaeosphaeria sp. MPI-PUGE-AT-0046c]